MHEYKINISFILYTHYTYYFFFFYMSLLQNEPLAEQC